MTISLGSSVSYPDDSFWITQFEPNGWGNEYTESVDTDNNGDVYVVSIRYNSGGSGYKGLSLVKLNSTGALQWQKYLNYSTNQSFEGRSVSVLPDGSSIFVTGQGDQGMIILKYNSSGVLSWANRLGGTNPNNVSYGTSLTSSGELVVLGRDHGGLEHTFISQIASNGSQTFHSSIGRTSGDATSLISQCKPFVDSSGNIHFVVKANTTPTPGVVKYNSSGVLQSVSDYSTSDDFEDLFADIAVDSSGNKYITYRRRESGLIRSGILKLDSSDVIQWQRDVSSTNAIYPLSINIHPSGDIISAFEDRRTGQANIIIRQQSNGSLVWKREFRHTSYTMFPSVSEVRLNRNGNIILNGYFNTPSNTLTTTCQLPSDGSLTGTYNSFVWQVDSSVSVSTYTGWTKDSSSIFSAKTSTMAISSFSSYTVGDNILAATTKDVDGISDPPQDALFTTAGSWSWTAPTGVTSVCVVCVGAGGRGGGAGGGGGGLGWRNNISVTPGQNYLVVVGSPGVPGGADGGDSYFINTSTVRGGGGQNGWNGGSGGTYTGPGGGPGGSGSAETGWGGGGGGAGGYSGNGGNANTLYGSSGSGGGGGGGAGHSNADSNDSKRKGGGGGGVGIYGQGANGSGAPSTTYGGDGGLGGSGGTPGNQSSPHIGGNGGQYGGGSGGANGSSSWAAGSYGGQAGGGAVRIVWRSGASFPTTNVGQT